MGFCSFFPPFLHWPNDRFIVIVVVMEFCDLPRFENVETQWIFNDMTINGFLMNCIQMYFLNELCFFRARHLAEMHLVLVWFLFGSCLLFVWFDHRLTNNQKKKAASILTKFNWLLPCYFLFHNILLHRTRLPFSVKYIRCWWLWRETSNLQQRVIDIGRFTTTEM